MSEKTCPVCGKHEFEQIGYYEDCPICGWVEDSYDVEYPDEGGGYNRIPLNEARKNFKEHGRIWINKP